MDIRKPDFSKITLCLDYLMLLDRKLDSQELDEKTKADLERFFQMVFNLAYYEFALAYNAITEESNDIIRDYLKKMLEKGKDGKGGLDGRFKI